MSPILHAAMHEPTWRARRGVRTGYWAQERGLAWGGAGARATDGSDREGLCGSGRSVGRTWLDRTVAGWSR
jgi:hypothetical protein